jgi:hypothetical protein
MSVADLHPTSTLFLKISPKSGDFSSNFISFHRRLRDFVKIVTNSIGLYIDLHCDICYM